MGSSSANTKSTSTSVITTSNNSNVVQNINKPTTVGADAVKLAEALGGALSANLHELVGEQEYLAQQAGAGLQTLAAGVVARGNGSELETPGGASSVSAAAQFTKPLIIGAVILGAAYFLSKGK